MIGNATLMYGLATVPGSNAVPEPGSLALLAAAGLAALWLRRRHAAAGVKPA